MNTIPHHTDFEQSPIRNSVPIAPERRPYKPEGIMIESFGHPCHDKDGQKYAKRGADSTRRAAEGAFPAFKRAFGEHVMSPKWESIIQKIRIKAAPYSKWRDESIARELERNAQHNGMKVILLHG